MSQLYTDVPLDEDFGVPGWSWADFEIPSLQRSDEWEPDVEDFDLPDNKAA